MTTFDQIASAGQVKDTIAALKANGIGAELVPAGPDASRRALEIIPAGAEIMTMTSVTLGTLGLAKELNESGKYDSVRAKLAVLDRDTQKMEQKRLGSAPAWTIGSVHAVTADGEVLIASNTGSQLPAYAYGAGNILWIVGAQKLVPALAEGLERVRSYVLPLEAERARKAYGVSGSNISKLLIISREVEPGRIKMIIVGEPLGF